MSLGGVEKPGDVPRWSARRSLEEQVRQVDAPVFGDGSLLPR